MKEMKIKTINKENNENVMVGIQEINFASDYFKCTVCGYTTIMKAPGNHPRCPECGKLMKRC